MHEIEIIYVALSARQYQVGSRWECETHTTPTVGHETKTTAGYPPFVHFVYRREVNTDNALSMPMTELPLDMPLTCTTPAGLPVVITSAGNYRTTKLS